MCRDLWASAGGNIPVSFLCSVVCSGCLGFWHVHQQHNTHTHTHMSVPTSDRVIIHVSAKAESSVTVHMNKHIELSQGEETSCRSGSCVTPTILTLFSSFVGFFSVLYPITNMLTSCQAFVFFIYLRRSEKSAWCSGSTRHKNLLLAQEEKNKNPYTHFFLFVIACQVETFTTDSLSAHLLFSTSNC